MTMATTATRAECVTAFTALENAAIMLRDVVYGSGTPAAPGRFTAAQVDAQLTAVTAAITAINA